MPKKSIPIKIECVNQPSQRTKEIWSDMLIENYLKSVEKENGDRHMALTLLEKVLDKDNSI